MAKKSLTACKSGKHFVSYSSRQGAEVREGARHTIVKTEKGSVAVPRHGNKDLATGTRHTIIKSLLAIGIVCFMVVMALDALSPDQAAAGAEEVPAWLIVLDPVLRALESAIAWVIAA